MVVTFFFPWITVSVRSRLLFRIILLFLLSSGISLAYLTAFFLSVEAPEETVHWQFSADSCGDSSSVSFEDDQSAPSHCHVQQGTAWFRKDRGHCSASPPLFLLARDLTGQETTQQTCVCPCRLLKKKFSPGLVSCDLAVEQTQNS